MNPFRRKRPVTIPALTEPVIFRVVRAERDRLLNEYHGLYEYTPAFNAAVIAMTSRACRGIHREMVERYGEE